MGVRIKLSANSYYWCAPLDPHIKEGRGKYENHLFIILEMFGFLATDYRMREIFRLSFNMEWGKNTIIRFNSIFFLQFSWTISSSFSIYNAKQCNLPLGLNNTFAVGSINKLKLKICFEMANAIKYTRKHYWPSDITLNWFLGFPYPSNVNQSLTTTSNFPTCKNCNRREILGKKNKQTPYNAAFMVAGEM